MTLEQFYDLPEVEDVIAAWEIDQERCPHHGGPRSECPDSDRDWNATRTMCWPEAQLKAAMRILELLHKDAEYHDGTFSRWSKEASIETPFRYDDGQRFYMSPIEVAPWDKWTTDVNASPDKPDDWQPEIGEPE